MEPATTTIERVAEPATVAIYARISRDQKKQAVGVERQEAACRRLVEQHYPDQPVMVFVDNDLSAASPGVHRPQYEALLSAIRAGRVGVLVSWAQDRLTRQPEEWEHLIKVLGVAGIAEVHTVADGIVPIEEGSRLISRLKAAVAAEEAERGKARTRAAHEDLARQGRPHGSAPFGYRSATGADGRPTWVVDPDQAATIRWAVDQVFAGRSLMSIRDELIASGAATKRGGRWTTQQVRGMVTVPSIAGLRAHHGEIVGQAIWEPIIPEATWRQVNAVLGSNRVVQTRDGRTYPVRVTHRPATLYPLTGGITVCGVCGQPLEARRRHYSRPGSPLVAVYACTPNKGGRSCVGIKAELLEPYVEGLVIEALTSPRLVQAIADSDDHAEDRARVAQELDEILARRTELSELWAAGDLTRDEWTAARSLLAARETDARKRLNALAPLADQHDINLLAETWPDLPVPARQRIIGAIVEKVVVHRYDRSTQSSPADRITIDWRV